MDEKTMTRLMVLETDVEAIFYKSVLEDNKIHCVVSGVDASALGEALDGPGEIEMFVYAEDLENAKELIISLEEEEGDEIPEWKCDCGEEVDEGFGVCWSCGAEYKPESA